MVFAALVIAGHPGRDRRKDFDEVPRLFKWVKPRVDYYQRRRLAQCLFRLQHANRASGWQLGNDRPGKRQREYAIHEGYMSLGSFFDISISSCTSGDCVGVSGQHYFWQPGTTTVNHCSTNCGGHSVPGYNTWLNFTSFPKVGERQFTAPNTVSFWPGTLPSPCCTQMREAHMSWNNDNPNDT